VRVPIKHPAWSSGVSVFVQGSAESVSSVDIEVLDLRWQVDRFG